jgi:hypothetical protein
MFPSWDMDPITRLEQRAEFIPSYDPWLGMIRHPSHFHLPDYRTASLSWSSSEDGKRVGTVFRLVLFWLFSTLLSPYHTLSR